MPDVLAHRAADQRDLPVERRRRVDHLLHAMDVRGEARDDDPALGSREDLFQMWSDHALRRGETGAVRVGRVAAEEQHALAAELGQTLYVRGLPVDRGLVELVITGHEHRADIAGQRDRAGIRDRVGHVDQLDVERAGGDLVARQRLDQLDVPQLVLVELGACHRKGQPRRRRPAAAHRSSRRSRSTHGQRAEVVLVTVGDHDRLDVIDAIAQVGEVRQHQIDPEHLGRRETQPDVDHDDRAVVLDHHHVLADLAQAAERQDAQLAAPAHARWRVAAGRGARAAPGSPHVSLVIERHVRQARLADLDPDQIQGRLVAAGGGRDRHVAVYVGAARRRSSCRLPGSLTMRRISSPKTWLPVRIPPASPMSRTAASRSSLPA